MSYLIPSVAHEFIWLWRYFEAETEANSKLYSKNMQDILKSNPKSFLQFINRRRKALLQYRTIVSSKWGSNLKSIWNALAQYFCNSFTSCPVNSSHNNIAIDNGLKTLVCSSFTTTDVFTALNEIKPCQIVHVL